MFNDKKFTLHDIFLMIENTGIYKSSSDTIYTFNENPVHLAIHREISKFTKEELESYSNENPRRNLYSCSIYNQSYLAFASLISKGAFVDDLNKDSKWLLNNIEPLNLEVYESIFHIQSSRYKNDVSNLLHVFEKIINNLDEKYREKNIDNFIQHYKNTILDEMINFDLSTSFFSKAFIKNNININEKFALNKYLPNNRSDSSFFISSLNFKDIKRHLENGYRFDEENYRYQNETLMTSLLKAKRIDLIDLILPYLNKFEPADNDENKHYAIIESYKNKSFYDTIKKSYDYYFLNQKIHNNNEPTKRKLKI